MMKRKKKRLVGEFEKLLQEDGKGYTIGDFSKTPLPILKMLVKELTEREKIKRKTDRGI